MNRTDSDTPAASSPGMSPSDASSHSPWRGAPLSSSTSRYSLASSACRTRLHRIWTRAFSKRVAALFTPALPAWNAVFGARPSSPGPRSPAEGLPAYTRYDPELPPYADPPEYELEPNLWDSPYGPTRASAARAPRVEIDGLGEWNGGELVDLFDEAMAYLRTDS